MRLIGPVLLLLLAGCVGDRTFSEDPLVNARPYLSAVPGDYAGEPTPLILTLHGFGSSGMAQGVQSGLQDLVTPRGFILVAPDGEELIPDERGWGISCCDDTLSPGDDVAYLRAVIQDISTKRNVDPKRIYVTGFSNGAFMAYLFACRAADLVAAVAIHAGTIIEGELPDCTPEVPVAVLHSQGTADTNVDIDGGSIDFGVGPFDYVSAETVIDFWRGIDGCSDTVTTDVFDGDTDVDGNETTSHRYADCSNGTAVEYWEMAETRHAQTFTDDYLERMIDFLYAHPKK